MPTLSIIRERAKAASVESVVARLGVKLKRLGAELVGPCPKCGGTDRFSINTTKRVFYRRGCGARGDVIDLVMHVCGVNFCEAIEFLTNEHISTQQPHQAATAPQPATPLDDMLARADDLWRSSAPIAGTPGETWLASRGIILDDVPDHGGLRFHPACPAPCLRSWRALPTSSPERLEASIAAQSPPALSQRPWRSALRPAQWCGYGLTKR
jgi:hypothetical protein